MMSNLNKNIILQDSDYFVIKKLVEKYNLGPTDFFSPEVEEKMRQAKTIEEKIQAADSFPIVQIPRILIEVSQKQGSTKDLTVLLQKKLNIPEEIAKKITQELERDILTSTRKNQEEKIPEKEVPKEEISFKKTPIQKDIYREPLE